MHLQKFLYAATTSLVFFSCNVFSEPAQHGEVPLNLRRLWGLIEYIRGDYPKAVEKAGAKIINATEYDEMQEFSDSALHHFHDLSQKMVFKDKNEIHNELERLKQDIRNKAPYSQIIAHTETIKSFLLQTFPQQAFPQQKISFSSGKENYHKTCSQCHGIDGQGDGILAASLSLPKPRNFHDTEPMELGSPFKFFNTLETGIAGTTMQSYGGIFKPAQIWDLSFYLMGLRFYDKLDLNVGQEPANSEIPESYKKEISWLLSLELDLAQLAQMSDKELQTWLQEQKTIACKFESPACKDQANSDIETYLALARLVLPYVLEPKKAQSSHPITYNELTKALNYTHHTLEVARNYFRSGNYNLAEQKILDAYLHGFEKVEKSLGLEHRNLVLLIEQDFLDLRAYAKKANLKDFSQKFETVTNRLTDCQDLLSQIFHKKKSSLIGNFIGAFIIIIREGIEAFLIIAALLALLNSAGLEKEKRWVHLGWLCAIAAGIISYIIFEKIIRLSGSARETMEAVTTGIAVVLLFYTGFWLLSQGEHRKWQKFIRSGTGQALSKKSLAAIFSLSFIAVYREAVETVVFYSAMLMVSQNPYAILLGFLAGCGTLLALCWGIIKFNIRLPLQKFFKGTSALLVLLSIILAGKSAHELIEAGFFQATPVPFMPIIEFLGVYPSMETLGAQFALVVLSMILLINSYLRSKKDSISSSMTS